MSNTPGVVDEAITQVYDLTRRTVGILSLGRITLYLVRAFPIRVLYQSHHRSHQSGVSMLRVWKSSSSSWWGHLPMSDHFQKEAPEEGQICPEQSNEES